MSMGTAASARDALISEMRSEYERIQMRLKELQLTIEQSQAEVRRLQQRSVETNMELSRLETSFDTVPRSDIKKVYTAVLEVRTRLLSMQGQLEKFQQDRLQLESFGKSLRSFLDQVEGAQIQVVGLQSAENNGSSYNDGLSSETIIRIVESQESERQRLARQMHDGPAQSLTNFILQAEICRRLFDRNPERAAEELESLKSTASVTFQRVRDFIFELRPMMLDDLGLAPTIRRYVQALQDKGSIDARINIVGEERRRMEPHSEVLMFRGLQEVLAYARDISNSTQIDIMLDVSGNPIKANINFNGKQLDETEEFVEQSKGKMFGLLSIRHRLELVGGTLEYEVQDDRNNVAITLPAEEFN